MFCMYIDIDCVGTAESNLSPVCVQTEVMLVHGRLSFVLYVYCHRVR